jgi:putative nucleotidyltransferase with HDIG domain
MRIKIMQNTASHATKDLANDIARSLVEDVSDLVSPPDVCVKVFELAESPDASAQQIGDVISRDPGLTARLLKLVNSSYYNFSRKIDTVTRAVTIVGVRELYSLVLAVSAIKSFSNLPNALVNIDSFWRHGIFTGLIARDIAKQCHILHPERLFVAGLLHDIGSLVLYSKMPEQMSDLLMVADGDEGILHQAELTELGFSHADLGGAMAQQWMLPDALQEAITYHHLPAYSQAASTETAIVHLAEALANQSEIGAFCENPGENQIDPVVWEILGIAAEDFDTDAAIGGAGLQFVDTASLLLARA